MAFTQEGSLNIETNKRLRDTVQGQKGQEGLQQSKARLTFIVRDKNQDIGQP